MEFQFDHRIKSFILYSLINNHLTLYLSYLGMNYNNKIGFILFIIFLLQLLSGILLSSYYIDSYTIAYNTVVYIVIDVNVGFIIRLLHVLGATFFMFLIFIH